MMSHRTDIKQHLNNFGIYPIEIDGWPTRGGSDFDPGGSVNHHTAGPRLGNHPSLHALINGVTRPDGSFLSGPLTNLSVARDLNVYLIAAGTANHAGTGGWNGLIRNRSVWGLEIEHTGNLSTEPAPTEEAWDLFARIHAAFAKCSGSTAASVCQHFEWTSRKIDFIGANGNDFRNRVQYYLHSQLPNPPDDEDEDDMKRWIVRGPQGDVYVFNGETLRPANDVQYRDAVVFHGAMTPQTTGTGPEPWFNWAQESINSVPKVSGMSGDNQQN